MDDWLSEKRAARPVRSRRRLWLGLAGFIGLCIIASAAAFEFTSAAHIFIPDTKTIDAEALGAHLQAAGQTAAAQAAQADAPAEATPTLAQLDTPTPTAVPIVATSTSTGPTATPTKTATATPRPTPPPPAAAIPWPKTLNIVLLGTDKRPTDGTWRTDTMIIVAIDPDAKQVGVISVPRDLWIILPNYANRINTLDYVGGPEFVKQALQYEFGIPIHYYARVNFSGFVKAVDTVGGITVDVQCRIDETGGELGDVHFPSGPTAMDGQTALTFARSRLTTTDYDRMRRQQAVMLAFRKKLLSPDMLPHLPDLVGTLSQMTQTDIPPQTLLSLARLGAEIDLKNVHGFLLDERVMQNVISSSGASVTQPNPEVVKTGLDNLFTGQSLTDAIKRPKTWDCK